MPGADALQTVGHQGDRSWVERFPGRTVLVAGDVMLDQFLIGRVNRISPEAPVPVVEYGRDEYRLGGAANVAHNIRALGGKPLLVGLIGADVAAEHLRAQLRASAIGADSLVVDYGRPTTRKLRIVTDRRHQVARVDYESDREPTGEVEAALVHAAERAAAKADVIVVSDYLKGVVTREVMHALMRAARRRGVSVLVDPKIPHLSYYAGATLITPNHLEAEVATHRRIRTEDDAREAARAFRQLARCQSVMITRGEHGLWLLEGASSTSADTSRAGAGSIAASLRESAASLSTTGAAAAIAPTPMSMASQSDVLVERNLAAVAREVADVTGAGDTVIATVAMSFAAGAGLVNAAALANHAAGISVAKFGPAAVTHEELLAAVDAASNDTRPPA
jgi:D-beta-D-heptose 7-phosphate kinase/D-beta-D-heptose 1-phosphate adenosyltransferase